jgi:enoyl-CoA hydratase/carnithine racemase
MFSNERIRIELRDGVADVRLIRADKMNALDDAMFDSLIEASGAIAARDDVRVVVLSGEGRAFCSGLDRGNFGRMAQGTAGGLASGDRLLARTHGIANRPQWAVWGWRSLPVPVIAAVHGVALGGGFQVALGADLRYVHPDTKMSILEIKWGLVPDMAGTPIMRTLAREDVIRELTYTGRIFSGREAYEYGFATRLCDDPYAAALETAREIADKSPSAIRANKRMMNQFAFASDADLLMVESREQAPLIGGADQIEAIRKAMARG